ncbi:MAG: hypothetical protein ACXWIU_06435, partial [Limisphaerales bacterium]
MVQAQSELIETLSDKDAAKTLREKRKNLKLDYILEDCSELIKESLEGAERVRTIIGLFVLTVAIHSQAALKFYVATNGNDGWSGHFGARRKNGKDGPLASLPEAIRRARSERRGGSVEIILRDGV